MVTQIFPGEQVSTVWTITNYCIEKKSSILSGTVGWLTDCSWSVRRCEHSCYLILTKKLNMHHHYDETCACCHKLGAFWLVKWLWKLFDNYHNRKWDVDLRLWCRNQSAITVMEQSYYCNQKSYSYVKIKMIVFLDWKDVFN